MKVMKDFGSVEEMLGNPSIQVVEISGMGPQYEDACLTIFLRTLKYLEDNDLSKEDVIDESGVRNLKEEVEKELIEKMDDIGPTGAMFHSGIQHALYVREKGYKNWIENVKEERVRMWGPHLGWKSHPKGPHIDSPNERE